MNPPKASKKRLTFLVVLPLLLIIASIFVIITNRKFETASPARTLKHYSQLVNERCHSNFPIVDIIYGDDCFWGFQDIRYELKCKLNSVEKVTDTSLLQDGWQCSTFPEEFVEEGILGRTTFTEEMYAANLQQQSYWIYIDREVEQHGKMLHSSHVVYQSSHYLVALYLPNENVLYYLENSI